MQHNAIIILAAGNASRMGKAKQLLFFNNKTFLHHIIEEAQNTTGKKVVLVLGAYADEIKNLTEKIVPNIAVNAGWKTGMAGSIKNGLNTLLQLYPETENAIITVTDQPFVSADLFKQIFTKKNESGKGIVACLYSDTIGTPVLFSKKYFPELLQLQGMEGAKKIILKYPDDTSTILFEKGAIDIDTEEDYKRLLNST